MNEFEPSDRRKQSKPFKERIPPEWKAEDLPPLITPQGHGFMPLFSSAHWIAVCGGMREPNPKDEEFWTRAYRELLDAICSSGKVTVVGSRIGAASERFELKPELFVGCAIQYPYPIEDFEWNFADDEVVLRSFPYDDEDDWRNEFSDALVDRSQLMVRKSDVRRLWPFTVLSASKTGVPGRPPSIFHSQNEFDPIKYAVPGYIAEGLTLFAGKPKLGKSWFCMEIGLAIATGSVCLGDVKCEQGDVLISHSRITAAGSSPAFVSCGR